MLESRKKCAQWAFACGFNGALTEYHGAKAYTVVSNISLTLKTFHMTSNDTGAVLLALLTGAAIGAGAGILYAPDKGSKTRKKIKKNVRDAKQDISLRVQRASEELNHSAKERKQLFEQQLEESISNMSYKAEDIIETLERKLAELKARNAQLHKDARPAPVKS